MAAYYSGKNAIGQQNANSRQQDSNTKVDAEKRKAQHQAIMDDLDAQLKAGKISGQQYIDAKNKAQADLLNPNPAASPAGAPPANNNGAPAANPPANNNATPAAPPAQGTQAPVYPKPGDGKEWHRGGPDNSMMYKNPDGTFTDVNGRKRDSMGNPI
ncbi:MAG: hypothetical protein HQK96_18240 [Nitrospirae bacterium]|nr:hypothetical protein [Nitrospirota bacterium]